MKNILILIFLAIPLLGFSQVRFSSERPEGPTVVKQLQSKVDTVFLLTQAGIQKGVRVTPVYEILYDRDRSQEEELFYGNSDFFVEEEGHWSKPVQPIAYRLEVGFSGVVIGSGDIQLFPRVVPKYNNLGQ